MAEQTSYNIPKLPSQMYGPDYYSQLMDKFTQMGQEATTGPQAQARAKQQRSQMAGAGVLPGSAFTAEQADWAKGLQSQYSQEALGAATTAMGEEAKYEAGLPAQQQQLLSSTLTSAEQAAQATGGTLESGYVNALLNAMGMPSVTPASPIGETAQTPQQLAEKYGFASETEMTMFATSNPEDFRRIQNAVMEGTYTGKPYDYTQTGMAKKGTLKIPQIW